MQVEAQRIVDEIEAIKARLISLEVTLLEEEEPAEEDKRALEEALSEYKKGKTSPFPFKH